ncbi:hypothetical protein B0H11DRAFT_2238821 [Mycena galericulata]|nr:hypothetical protein B0H11DRAFT_2238821 [Mycena galericulata]
MELLLAALLTPTASSEVPLRRMRACLVSAIPARPLYVSKPHPGDPGLVAQAVRDLLNT